MDTGRKKLDLSDRRALLPLACHAEAAGHAVTRGRRPQGEFGIQRHDLFALVGPEAMAVGAAIPLRKTGPIAIFSCHASSHEMGKLIILHVPHPHK